MERGDISNVTIPRVLLVFEGAVGTLPPGRSKAFGKAVARKRWDDAVACWELEEMMLRKIWDVTLRKSITVEVVTFLPEPFADMLAARLDEEDVPVHRVWATTPVRLVRRLPYMPDVSRVYDPDSDHVLSYGAKGRYLTSPNQLGE